LKTIIYSHNLTTCFTPWRWHDLRITSYFQFFWEIVLNSRILASIVNCRTFEKSTSVLLRASRSFSADDRFSSSTKIMLKDCKDNPSFVFCSFEPIELSAVNFHSRNGEPDESIPRNGFSAAGCRHRARLTVDSVLPSFRFCYSGNSSFD
jgi:hypothetical protein